MTPFTAPLDVTDLCVEAVPSGRTIPGRGDPGHRRPHKILPSTTFRQGRQGGQVIALLGPTGSGKSTFLRALAYSASKEEMGGQDRWDAAAYRVSEKSDALKGHVSYLPAHDILLGELTVFEFMKYRSLQVNAKLRGEHCKLIIDLLEELSLLHIADRVIGVPGLKNSLSGGERRRLAIATELLTTPSALILDEPTTGVDLTRAFQLLKHLRQIAESRGIPIIVSMHHPSRMLLSPQTGVFTRILMMDRGGRMISDAAPGPLFNLIDAYHKSKALWDPANNLVDLICDTNMNDDENGNVDNQTLKNRIRSTFAHDRPDLEDECVVLGKNTMNSDEIQDGRRSIVTGFSAFTKRHFLIRWRMTNTLWVWAGRAVVALLACTCFWNVMHLESTTNFYDHRGLLFVLLMHFQYETLYLAQANLDEERRCYAYELRSGAISPLTLTLGRVPAEFAANLINVIPLTTLLMLSGWGFHDIDGMVLATKLTVYSLFILCFASMWKAVGMWFTAYRKMTWIGDLYVNLTMQVSGFWTALSAINASGQWIKYLSVISHAFNALVITGLSDREYIERDWEGNESSTTGQVLLDAQGIDIPIWLNIAMLLVLFCFFEMIAYTGAKFGRSYLLR